MTDKIRTKKFWISLAGIVIMLLQLLGVKVDAPYVNEVINSICAVCVVIGLMDGGKNEQTGDSEDEVNRDNGDDGSNTNGGNGDCDNAGT